MSKEATDFETEFSKLLQQGKKDEARQHLAGGKTEDLDGLTRVAQCRAVVLMEGEAEDVETTAMAPKYLRLPANKLSATLHEVVEAYRKTGKGEVRKRKKVRNAGVKKGARGLKPGAPPPEDGEDAEAPDETPDETPSEEPQEPAEAAEKPDEAPEPSETPSVDSGAVQELLERVNKAVDAKLSEIDEKMGEVLINTGSVVTAMNKKGGQEKRLSTVMERIEEKLDRYQVLYEQQGYLIDAMSLAGGSIMDISPDEFHQAVLGIIEERAKERKAQLSKEGENDEEEAAEDGGEKSDEE